MAKTKLQILEESIQTLLKNKPTQTAQQPLETDIVEATNIKTSNAVETKNGGEGKLGEKILKGAGYIGEKFGLGLARGIEGVTDFVVGGIADMFGGDEFAENIMKNDWFNYSHAEGWYDPGEGMQFIGDVASGIGNMLPAIVVSAATAGAAAPVALAGGIGSTALFGLGAAGQATSEAVKETGELGGKEWLYGSASGALEAGIEKLTGGIGGTAPGKVITKQLGKNVLGKTAISFVGEGVEEVLSDLADPLLKKATGVDKDAKVDWGNLPRTFLVGGTTGAVMGGGRQLLGSAKAGGFNKYNATQTAQELTERQADNNLRQAEGKKAIYTEKDINRTAQSLSNRLQKMSTADRQSFMERNANLAPMFNADGTLVESTAGNLTQSTPEGAVPPGLSGGPDEPTVDIPTPEGGGGVAEGGGGNSAMGSGGSNLGGSVGGGSSGGSNLGGSVGGYNPNSYSASLKGREGTFKYKPLSTTSSVSKAARTVMNTLTKLTKGNTNIVLTDELITTENGTHANGLYKDGIIYLDANAKDADKLRIIGTHEVIHSLEGTKAYKDLAKYIVEKIQNDPALLGKYDYDKYRDAYDAILEGEWTEGTKDYQALTEIFADYLANEVLTSEDSIRRLTERDANFIVKLYRWLKDTIARLGSSEKELAMKREMRKMERLIAKALDAGQGGVSLEVIEERMRAAEREEMRKARQKGEGSAQNAKLSPARASVDKLKKKRKAEAEENVVFDATTEETAQKDIDKQNNVRYNKPQGRYSVSVTKYKKIPQYERNYIYGELTKLYSGVDDGIADGIAFSQGNTIFVVDSGKDNGKIDFGVRQKIKVTDSKLRMQQMEAINERTISKGNVSSELLGRIRDASNYGDGGSSGRELSQKLSADKGQPQNQQSGVSQSNGNRGTQGLKSSTGRASLAVDSAGNTLTTEQAEYFKDSKVRDKDGNLMVVYHGTRKADFTEFKRNVNYFTDSSEMADSYAPSSEKYIGYLDIKKPFIIDANGEKWSRVPIDAKTKEFLEKYGASTFKENGKWRTSPADIASSIESGIDEGTLDYDGIIIKNIDDTGRYWKTKGNIVANDYITFKSNQFKNTTNKTPTKKADIRYSLPVNVEADVKKHYGSTYRWNETGYILKDGTRLDLSGRNEGASGGYRAVDHRDIFTIFDDDDYSYGTDALNEFIARGNIRVMPETPGINLSVEPNAEQYRLIQDFVERVGWNEGYFSVDIDNEFGDTIETLTYEGKPSGRKVVADLKYYFKEGKVPYKSNLSAFRYSLDPKLDEKTSSRVKSVVKDKRSVQEVFDETWEKLKYGSFDLWLRTQISLTDEQAGILLAGRNVGVALSGEVQRARSAKAAALNMLTNEQRDYSGTKRVGESLRDIFKPIQKRGPEYAKSFNLYLYHQLNIDRMSAVDRANAEIKKLLKANPQLANVVAQNYNTDAEFKKAVSAEVGGKEYLRLKATENKPVFEEDVTADFSKEKVAQLEKQHPSFKAQAEKVWGYAQNLLQYRVDAGLITQAQADQMSKMYPHYVPAYYEVSLGTSGAYVGKKGVQVKTGIKKAKGSTGVADISDISKSMSQQTIAVMRAASLNKIATKLYDGAEKTKTFIDIEVADRKDMNDPDVNYDEDIPKKNQVVFYKDGERITLNVSEYVYAGFEGLTVGGQFNDPIVNLGAKAIDLFKKAVTSHNPAFLVRNAFKDVGEALWNTKYGFFNFLGRNTYNFFGRMFDPRMKELWQQYVAMGGTASGFYAKETGIYDSRGKVRKAIGKAFGVLEIANNYIEQGPRFAEFVLSLKAGNSLEQALYDSAEVTTNFSRGGHLTKKLNRSVIPFLNPSVQGWSKLYRTFVDPMDKYSERGIKELSKSEKGRKLLSYYGLLIVKAVATGVGVGLFNDMLYKFIDEDEDYKDVAQYVKENNFLIKIPNKKKFIKIPKGRVASLFGMTASRITDYANGDKDALNAWEWANTAWEAMSPVETASRTIFSPLKDIATNTTWYGGNIENQSMKNLSPAQRYDEATSSIAIAIGQATNYSPKKIHYLIDQYTGVWGDFFLPMTTNKAEQDVFSSNFVVDPAYTNDISTKYYDLTDELTYAKNDGDKTAAMVLKYLNQTQETVSDMYQQKRDIANDNSLSNKEKREQTEILQSLINGTLSSAIETAEVFEQTLIDIGFEGAVSVLMGNKGYSNLNAESKTYAYNKLTDYYYQVCSSTINGKKMDTKYVLYSAVNATDLVVYLADIKNISADIDRAGNPVSGSRKQKVQRYIQGLNLTIQQKYILSYLVGYAPTDAGKNAIARHLMSNGYSRQEVNELWNK